MILNLPGPTEFFKSSLSLLNLAWSTASTLMDSMEAVFGGEAEGEVTAEYWTHVQVDLGNAYTLVEQAQEFALKAKIAAVSPYLLIGTDPREWPRQCDKRDTEFSDFYTIDANNLIKIHDTVASTRIDSKFVELFNEARRTRNRLMHAAATQTELRSADIFKMVLATVYYLHPGISWFRQRILWYSEDPLQFAYTYDFTREVLLQDFGRMVEILSDKETQIYLGFFKKRRRYYCIECEAASSENRLTVKPAQLEPNTPDATLVRCAVCEHGQVVVRQSCPYDGCKGNVLAIEAPHGAPTQCLTCGEQMPEPDDNSV